MTEFLSVIKPRAVSSSAGANTFRCGYYIMDEPVEQVYATFRGVVLHLYFETILYDHTS